MRRIGPRNVIAVPSLQPGVNLNWKMVLSRLLNHLVQHVILQELSGLGIRRGGGARVKDTFEGALSTGPWNLFKLKCSLVGESALDSCQTLPQSIFHCFL